MIRRYLCLEILHKLDEDEVNISVILLRKFESRNQGINGMNALWHSPGMNAI